MKKKIYSVALMAVLSMGAYAQDYYVSTTNGDVVQVSGSVDSVKIEGDALNFYQDDAIAKSILLANVRNIKFEFDPPALIPAMLTVAASDQVQDLSGDATSISITVEANRKIKVTVPAEASWLTATVGELEDVDPTTGLGKATVAITVTDNTTAAKGRTASIQLELEPSRDGDIVSGAAAKATIQVRQSLKGLVVPDLFDLKLSADGTAVDGTGNLTVEIGPWAPKVSLNSLYNRFYATIDQVESDNYADPSGSGPGFGGPSGDGLVMAQRFGWDVNPGNSFYELYNREYYANDADKVKYWSYDQDGWRVQRTEGNRRMCYYKMQWGGTNTSNPLNQAATVGQNDKIVQAYESAFSYELVFRVGEYGFNGNIFGNRNPSHCGFGIIAEGASGSSDPERGEISTGGRIAFVYNTVWGGGAPTTVDSNQPNASGSEEGVVVEPDTWYHVVVTYNRNAAIGQKAIVMYVDGKEITWVNNYDDLKNHGLQFPRDYYVGVNGEHNHEGVGRTPNTEYLVVGGGSHMSGRPTGGPRQGTQIMIARVYGKALTPAEVTASYNAIKPE
ncbi:hypothetical protein AGMMS49965_24570 [Bacteroidia bacterium]|nr:hypothetical protein AGMMS49965_24570 [Bacteroidia bacterium]